MVKRTPLLALTFYEIDIEAWIVSSFNSSSGARREVPGERIRAAASGSFFTRLGIRRSTISPAAPLSGRLGFHSDPVRPARHAPSSSLHEHESTDARNFASHRVSCRPDFQHFNSRYPSDDVCNDRSPNPGLGHRATRSSLWGFHVAAIHEHEYAGIR